MSLSAQHTGTWQVKPLWWPRVRGEGVTMLVGTAGRRGEGEGGGRRGEGGGEGGGDEKLDAAHEPVGTTQCLLTAGIVQATKACACCDSAAVTATVAVDGELAAGMQGHGHPH
jgi:hypothetical protein